MEDQLGWHGHPGWDIRLDVGGVGEVEDVDGGAGPGVERLVGVHGVCTHTDIGCETEQCV